MASQYGDNFYPRSPCGERPTRIDTHRCKSIFLSTFPLRGTSGLLGCAPPAHPISIHVPLAGNVNPQLRWFCTFTLFLSTFPLRGTSTGDGIGRGKRSDFYPRSPCGERPRCKIIELYPDAISIHVPLAGNVSGRQVRRRGAKHFYPRSPCGERLRHLAFRRGSGGHFYPRSPCGERPVWMEHCHRAVR